MMVPSPLIFALLAGGAFAAPVLTEVKARDDWQPPAYLNVSYTSPIRDDLPSIFILATGGTIAGKGASATDSSVYQAGQVGIDVLVEAVPELLNVTNIYGVQVSNVDSVSMNQTIQLELSRAVNDLLCDPSSPITSVIVTHGTDTLEETAFFLDSTYDCDKPLVFVGSMRPASAISADGPANLYAGVKVGISPESKGRGTLVVLNDRIGSAAWTQKTHLNYVDTFKGLEAGYLGGLYNNQPYYFYTPARNPYRTVFNLTGYDSIPRVDIIYGWQEADVRLLEYAGALDDVKGIVIAHPYPINTPDWDHALAMIGAIKPIVYGTRMNNGMKAPAETPSNTSTISSGLYNLQKSRVLLSLSLATGKDPREVFEGKLRQVLWGQ